MSGSLFVTVQVASSFSRPLRFRDAPLRRRQRSRSGGRRRRQRIGHGHSSVAKRGRSAARRHPEALARVGSVDRAAPRCTLRGQVWCAVTPASCMAPTVATMSTASNVSDQPKPPDKSRPSRCGTLFFFETPGFGRHRSQAREDVRACGFRVSAAEITLPATYCASLR